MRNNLFSLKCLFKIIILKKINEYLMMLPPQQRLCALKFDEMSIRAAEEYSKKYDVIEGVVDMGNDNRKPEITKHALLFLLTVLMPKITGVSYYLLVSTKMEHLQKNFLRSFPKS